MCQMNTEPLKHSGSALAVRGPHSVRRPQQPRGCRVYLEVDEGGEVELVSEPLTHKELVTLLLRQSVEELRKPQRERGYHGDKIGK